MPFPGKKRRNSGVSRASQARAFNSEVAHGLLKDVRLGSSSGDALTGIGEVIETYGSEATGAALEATLTSLVGLLGRLIGIDMVAQLVELREPQGTQDQDVK